MATPLPVRVLFVEDAADDVGLLVRTLQAGGFSVDWTRVEDAAGFCAALGSAAWDVILCDFSMRRFDPHQALAALRERGLDIPLLVVSGVIPESTAVALMKEGARDYVLKDNLPRLVPAVTRELRDAIARREARDAHRVMRRSESFFRTVIEHVSDLIAVTDLNGTILHIAPSVERIVGRNPEDLVGTYFLDLIVEADREASAAKLQALGAGPGVRAVSEVRFARGDASERLLECAATSFVTPAGDAAIVVNARDVTDRRAQERQLRETSSREEAAQRERLEAESALQQSEARLRQAQKMEAIGRLAGGIAHDFNNLLMAILGYGEIVAEQIGDHPAAGDVEQILEAGRRAAALTRQLLAFSRQQTLAPEILCPNDVVGDIAQLLGRLLGHDVELRLDLEQDVADIKVDRGQLEQVLMNLAVNARDAMPEGGTLRIATRSIVLGAETAAAAGTTPGAHVLLDVADSGAGMDAATMARIFEPFFTTKEKGQGTGLGLATVYGIVTQSGGGVEVESSPGLGTVFRVYFPAMQRPSPAQVADVEPSSG
ncbi:MAG: ATP-binding protein [Vicinamibacterales bacterium]